MEINDKKINPMIRYWILLEELKRKRDGVHQLAVKRGAIDLSTYTYPELSTKNQRFGKFDSL